MPTPAARRATAAQAPRRRGRSHQEGSVESQLPPSRGLPRIAPSGEDLLAAGTRPGVLEGDQRGAVVAHRADRRQHRGAGDQVIAASAQSMRGLPAQTKRRGGEAAPRDSRSSYPIAYEIGIIIQVTIHNLNERRGRKGRRAPRSRRARGPSCSPPPPRSSPGAATTAPRSRRSPRRPATRTAPSTRTSPARPTSSSPCSRSTWRSGRASLPRPRSGSPRRRRSSSAPARSPTSGWRASPRTASPSSCTWSSSPMPGATPSWPNGSAPAPPPCARRSPAYIGHYQEREGIEAELTPANWPGAASARHRPRGGSAGQPRSDVREDAYGDFVELLVGLLREHSGSQTSVGDRQKGADRSPMSARPTTAWGQLQRLPSPDPRIEAAIWAGPRRCAQRRQRRRRQRLLRAADREVIAVEPSPVMIAQRPPMRRR